MYDCQWQCVYGFVQLLPMHLYTSRVILYIRRIISYGRGLHGDYFKKPNFLPKKHSIFIEVFMEQREKLIESTASLLLFICFN